MSAKPSNQSLAASRKFIPELKPLESRLLLSQSQRVSFPDGTSFVFPNFNRLPRTGGVSVQTGTVLGIGVGQRSHNAAQVTDDGSGDFQAEWNGGPVRSFTSVKSIVIEARRARSNQITFNLTGQRTGPTAVAVGSEVPTQAVSASEGRHPLNVRIRRTSGSAIQSGSILTVTVDNPTTNIVAISNNGAGAVEVKWNGGAAHSFTNVATIEVDTRKATNDLIALNDVTT
jgi:hypothetical protein